MFFTGGAGIGVNIGVDAFGGAVGGTVDDMNGITLDINAAGGPVTGTAIFPVPLGEEDPAAEEGLASGVGGTIGGGIGLPIGGSMTVDATGTITFQDLMNLLGIERDCGCSD